MGGGRLFSLFCSVQLAAVAAGSARASAQLGRAGCWVQERTPGMVGIQRLVVCLELPGGMLATYTRYTRQLLFSGMSSIFWQRLQSRPALKGHT